MHPDHPVVIAAQAAIQMPDGKRRRRLPWTPACAGMTEELYGSGSGRCKELRRVIAG